MATQDVSTLSRLHLSPRQFSFSVARGTIGAFPPRFPSCVCGAMHWSIGWTS